MFHLADSLLNDISYKQGFIIVLLWTLATSDTLTHRYAMTCGIFSFKNSVLHSVRALHLANTIYDQTVPQI